MEQITSMRQYLEQKKWKKAPISATLKEASQQTVRHVVFHLLTDDYRQKVLKYAGIKADAILFRDSCMGCGIRNKGKRVILSDGVWAYYVWDAEKRGFSAVKTEDGARVRRNGYAKVVDKENFTPEPRKFVSKGDDFYIRGSK